MPVKVSLPGTQGTKERQFEPRAIFLRAGIALPDGLKLQTVPFGDNWLALDTSQIQRLEGMLRACNWRYLWIAGPSSRRAFAISANGATTNAIRSALRNIPSNFNTAELDTVQLTSYPGFHTALVSLHPRQIQQGNVLASATPFKAVEALVVGNGVSH